LGFCANPRGYRRKDDHFDGDHKPLPDLSDGELTALAREEAHEIKAAVRACKRHLQDLLRWHGGKGHW
jgi:hypothetical protein